MKYYRTKLSKYFKIIIVKVMNSNDNSNTGTQTAWTWTMKYSRYPIWTNMDTGHGTLLPYLDIKIYLTDDQDKQNENKGQ